MSIVALSSAKYHVCPYSAPPNAPKKEHPPASVEALPKFRQMSTLVPWMRFRLAIVILSLRRKLRSKLVHKIAQ